MRCTRCIPAMIFAALLVAALGFWCSADAATLTWTDQSNNELGFEIERATAPCSPAPTSFTKIGEVAANVVSYADATPEPGNKYCYRLRAWNVPFAGDPRQYSGYSNLAEYAFPFPVPASPGPLQVTPGP